jgi:hypothetical protein
VISNIDLEILGLFDKDITRVLSINQISKLLNKKYPYVNKKTNQLINRRILKKVVFGKAYLCSLNLQEEETIILLSLLELEKKKAFLKKNLSLKSSLPQIDEIKQTIPLTLVIFSGRKILFIIQDIKSKKALESKLKNVKTKIQILTKIDLQKRLLENKSILEDHIILYAFEKYYEYLAEIEDKLRIRYSPLI